MEDTEGNYDRRTVLSGIGKSAIAGAVGVAGTAGTASAVCDMTQKENATYSKLNEYKYNWDPSRTDHFRCHVFGVDGESDYYIEDVAQDIEAVFNRYASVKGWQVIAWDTNITGILDALQTDGCDPYLRLREIYNYWRQNASHSLFDQGGTLWLHDDDDGDSATEGGTFGGFKNDNFIGLPYYNDPDRAPISIKAYESVQMWNGDYRSWGACHEVGVHQCSGKQSWWDSDYTNGKGSHYLAHKSTESDGKNIGSLPAQPQYDYLYTDGCQSPTVSEFALYPGPCLQDAARDAIDYAKYNL